MILKAETDAAACILRSKRAQSGRKLTDRAALTGLAAREFLRRLAPSGRPQQRIEIGERARGAAKPTQPKGDPP